MDQIDLRKWEARCTQEEPPRCKAKCPLHVDGRELCKLLAAGQTDKAWAVLCKTMPFPSVTARICEGDCQKDCLRNEKGGGIELATLEKFCAENAKRTPPTRALPARGKTVAVFGAYLSGLAAAWDLGKKGFVVKLFCENSFEGYDCQLSNKIDRSLFEKEIAQLGKMNVSFVEQDAIDSTSVFEALEKYDAVFVDPKTCDAEKLGIATPDAVTLKTEKDYLFASATLNTDSPIRLIALGRKGALSIERAVQNASLEAGRGRENPFDTRLFTNISRVESAAPVTVPADGYSAELAREEAGRCILCECMECVNNCAYLKEFKSYPKAYARQIYNNASIVMGTRQSNTMINSCMLCGLCEELCPENFAMHELTLEARQDLFQKGHMPPSAHEFAMRDMDFADSEHCSISKHQPGTESSSYVFFPGCQLGASNPSVVEKSYSFLCSSLEGGTGLMLRCCGAPADWAGRVELFENKTQAIEDDWKKLGSPKIITACPSCLEALSSALPDAEITSLWSILDKEKDALQAGKVDTMLSLQDPCTARHNVELMTDVRLLLSELKVDFDEPELSGKLTECCGFGGLLSNANEPLSTKVAERRAEKLEHDGITYCAMCRDLLAKTGKRCMHILDVVFPSDTGDPASRPAPGYSERRENRVRLKETLLDSLWNETASTRQEFESIKVEFTPEARQMMEERRIMITDVQKTIQSARASGREIINTETGHKLIYFRPVTVTYWIEFESTEDHDYLVHRVWSHRMHILGEAK